MDHITLFLSTFKRIYPILLFSLLTIYANCQTISFSYDNSGNRTTRQMVVEESKSQYIKPVSISKGDLVTAAKLEDDLKNSEGIPSIFPNPTSGVLRINNIPVVKEHSANIIVTDLTGRPLISERISTNYAEINLTYYKNGIYLIQVWTGEKFFSWKVIKNER